MSEDQQRRTDEQATVLKHAVTSAFPKSGLAPWMSILKEKQLAVVIALRTEADIAMELDRQAWMEANPEKPLPEEMKETDPIPAEERLFDRGKVTGAAYMFGYCMERLAWNTHNMAPSLNGIGRVQALGFAKASAPVAVSTTPKPAQGRSLFERITGRGKEKEMT